MKISYRDRRRAGCYLGVGLALALQCLSAGAADSPGKSVVPEKPDAAKGGASSIGAGEGLAPKSKPIEGVARPQIAKPTDALAPKPADSAAKQLSDPTVRPPSDATARTSAGASSGGNPSATRSGRTINDVTVPASGPATSAGAVGSAAAATAAPKGLGTGQKAKDAALPEPATGDPLESRLRSLFDERLAKDGEVILRVSPETPLSKGGLAAPGAQRSAGGAATGSAAAAASQSASARPAAPSTDNSSGKSWDWSGPRGPQQWGRLDPANLLCSEGKMQSPTAVTEAMAIHSTMRLPSPSLGEAGFSWARNGPLWTVQIAGSASTQWREETWLLEAIQFRFPGEPFLGTIVPAGAVHLIHRKDDRRLILAAAMVGSAQAPRHAALTTLMQRFPTDPDDRPDWSRLRLPLRSFLPTSMDAGSVFPGSLSHPPCTEGVYWVLFDSPLVLPPEQLRELEVLLGRGHRPPQPTNARLVLRLQAAQP